MSLSEREINTIHANTSFIDGRKHFGKFDRLVASKPTTERILGNQDQSSEATIFIPIMERVEKLSVFLADLRRSIEISQSPISLVILDNSIERTLLPVIEKADFGSSVTQILYHYDSRMTQSTGRNYAFKHLLGTSQIIGLWDGDIYAAPDSIGMILNALRADPGLAGVAPPMAGYGGGNREVARMIYKYLTTNASARQKLHMPGPIGEENGVWEGEILKTSMMRGAFMIRRLLAESVSNSNPEGHPWLKDFVLWQNVPFFITAREKDFDFGYLMRQDSVVLHDDNHDRLSVSHSIRYRGRETLKSILLLMYRNEVFTPEGRELNKDRFLRYNIGAISKVTGLTEEESRRLQEEMLSLSKKLSESESRQDFTLDGSEEFGDILSDIVNLLNYDPVFDRVRKIKSPKPSRQIYSV